jgi:hypothetical protein
MNILEFDRKKIFFAVTVFFVLLLVAYLIFSKKNEAKIPINQDMTSTESPDIAKKPIQESTYVNKLITVSNPKDRVAVKGAFNQFLSSNPAVDVEWTNIASGNQKSISLEDFSQAVELNVNLELKKLLNQGKFDLFSCPSSMGFDKNVGIVMDIKLLPNYKGNLYADEVKIMKNWEKTLFQDIRTILFPNSVFSSDLLSQEIKFTDGNYRFAKINLPEGRSGSINYEIVDDFVVISNSQICLEKAKNQLFDTSN